MHACGHDGHMANLLGAAMVINRLKSHLHGRVKLVFQPAEEGGAGAKVMCDDGVLDNPKVDVMFGLHGWPEIGCGQVSVRAGAILAATTDFTIVVAGRGCHAATPHLGTDQVLIAAKIIEALHGIRARIVAPAEPMALSVTQVSGGTASNIIPSTVTFGGTLRTVSYDVRERCVAAIERQAKGIAEAHGATATVSVSHNYPPTVNHPAPTQFIDAVARAILPAHEVHELAAPSLGGEDFAYFLQQVPGVYFFLGVDDGRAGGYPSLHHPGFDFNDRALGTGIKMFTHAALAYAEWGRRQGALG